jgi:hypothetical protein
MLSLSETPAEYLIVFASPPCNAGRSYCSNFSLHGLLPAPDECMSHITRLYLKKLKEPKKLKRYLHVALAGSRIFLRAWQQVEGWECRGQMRLTEALVPARGWVLHDQRASRTGGKKG